jgi:acetyl esterase
VRAADAALNLAYERGLETFARAALRHPAVRRLGRRVEVERDVPYRPGGAPEHRVDIYRPAHGPALASVVYVHGGGFRNLSKGTHAVHALALADRGALVFNVGYRLAPRHPFPAALNDLADFLEWFSVRGEAHGADPTRIVWAGESAGANLVCALTIAACWVREEPLARRVHATAVRPRVLLPACGLLQVSDPGRFAGRGLTDRVARLRLAAVARGYLPDGHATPTACPLADPLVVLERADPPDRPLPAVMAGCGTADPLIDDTRRLAAALTRLGAKHQVAWYERGGHAFHSLAWRPLARRFWDDQVAFVRRCCDDTLI